MFVVHSDGYGMTNLDNVCEVSVSGRYIHAYGKDGSHRIIGVSDTEDGAKRILDRLVDTMKTSKSCVIEMGDRHANS